MRWVGSGCVDARQSPIRADWYNLAVPILSRASSIAALIASAISVVAVAERVLLAWKEEGFWGFSTRVAGSEVLHAVGAEVST